LEMGALELFVQAGLQPQSSRSQPPKLGLQAWATSTWLYISFVNFSPKYLIILVLSKMELASVLIVFYLFLPVSFFFFFFCTGSCCLAQAGF
jgi:hypothetical protein